MSAPRHSARPRVRTAPPADDPPRWRDPAASRPGQTVWQFISLWILGGCVPLVLTGMARGFKLGGTGTTVATAALLTVAVLVFLGLLVLLVRATPVVTPLGSTPARRLLWALLVASVGALTWLAGRAVADAHGLAFRHDGRLTVFLGGALIIPVAAVLARGWWLRTPAALVLVALAGAGLLAFRDNGPSDGDLRVARFNALPVEAWVVDVPGYRRQRQTFGLGEGGDEYTAAGSGRRIHLIASPVDGSCPPSRCEEPADTGRPRLASGGAGPTAVVRHGAVYLELAADRAVDGRLLVTALDNARPASEAELLASLPEAPGTGFPEHARSWLRRHT
ncbi:hypothetical protein ACTOB_002491 [Actinoplanes oblitus]|uniref:Uncharacterized protein n=1 Tax=Actinoplanes oblitus TaxID=3040509 RepID=A0ABY8WLV5_9ACTN|nr:hypothetical protein [Actinoplanes oblitus]WIM98871.1 hypothetical protein ACTOB_002491 [Actinoplanes oblitus]